LPAYRRGQTQTAKRNRKLGAHGRCHRRRLAHHSRGSMTLWHRFRSWLRGTFQRSRIEREMDAELRFHIDAYADDLVRAGVPREEAVRRARIEFGGIEQAKEQCRDARGVTFVDSLLQDIRFGLRMLAK